MTIEEYALKENITQTEVFRRAWEWCYGKPCGSNQVIIDSARYSAKHRIPQYMEGFLQKEKRRPVLPRGAVQNHDAYHKMVNDFGFTLVDEPTNLLIARRGRDGVWRSG